VKALSQKSLVLKAVLLLLVAENSHNSPAPCPLARADNSSKIDPTPVGRGLAVPFLDRLLCEPLPISFHVDHRNRPAELKLGN
jgi:hypothetical protein